MDYSYDDCNANDNAICTYNLSIFGNEPYLAAQVLNHILVDWPLPLREMIESRYNRNLMRQYSNDARRLLGRCLRRACNYDIFRSTLHEMWMRRAFMFFNHYACNPFFDYLYQPTENGNIFMFLDENRITNLRGLSFDDRNPKLKHINEILNIRIRDPDHSNGCDQDIFNSYQARGMTSAEYYFESHVIQFYRIMFFFLELEALGINMNEFDIVDGPLPYDLVPENIQAILYDDNRFRDYLLERRTEEESRDVVTNLDRRIKTALARSSRVREEVLYAALRSRIRNKHSGRTSTTTSTTTSTERSSTPETSTKDSKLSKKGSTWKNSQGKHFILQNKQADRVNRKQMDTNECGYPADTLDL